MMVLFDWPDGAYSPEWACALYVRRTCTVKTTSDKSEIQASQPRTPDRYSATEVHGIHHIPTEHAALTQPTVTAAVAAQWLWCTSDIVH